MGNKPFSRLFSSNVGLYLVVIFIIACISLYFNFYTGLIELAIFVALTLYSVSADAKREKAVEEYVQSLAFHMESTTKDSLLRFPLPLAVIQFDGTIIWYNEQFQRICDHNKLFDKSISDIIGADFDLTDYIDNKSHIGHVAKVGDKSYRVLSNVIKTANSEIFAVLYWLDETELVKLRDEYSKSRLVNGIIMIDNYEELMQNTDGENQTLLLATIERKLSDWVDASNGILKKIERDRYLYIFEHRYLEQYMQKRFDILDAVRDIDIGNKIPVTISIGVGINGGSIEQNDAFARSAIDMALGRGGDQVVIKDQHHFTYYGGKSKEIEKRTRVKTRVVAFALKELIEQAETVLVMGHINADLDSFGAALGLCTVIRNRGKNAHIVIETANDTVERLIHRIDKTTLFDNVYITRAQARELIDKHTLLIVVDVFKPSLTECPELLAKTDNIVVLDHHRKQAEFIENASLTYHEPYASSTCEMVTELLQYIEERLNLPQIVAEALYAGITMDTKNFTFKSGVRTFEAAAYLRRMGVDTGNVKQLFQNNMRLFAIRTEIVKSAEIYKEGIAIAIFKSDFNDVTTLAAQAADELLEIDGIVASFVLTQNDGFVHISGRSYGGINVQVILEKLGGGGHISLAGAQLGDVFVEEARQTLEKAIDEYIDENKK